MKPVIVGTAGHIDHGKSALVLALTGTDPDRLKEEKARGITIDLGLVDILERVRAGERGPRRSKAAPKRESKRGRPGRQGRAAGKRGKRRR